MSIALGMRLKVRTLVRLAAEPIPFFWPMRTFIHHNPLHGLEHLPFPEAARKGAELFHGRAFLPRPVYQRYLRAGVVDEKALNQALDAFGAERDSIGDIDLPAWLRSLLYHDLEAVWVESGLADAADIHAALQGRALPERKVDREHLKEHLRDRLLGSRPVYESVDALYGSRMGAELDEWVTKSCLDFLDEGQSVWRMPGRHQGLYASWRDLATRNLPFFLRGLHLSEILSAEDSPDALVAHIMQRMGIPEEEWQGYFTRELTRLHGWAGFIRWRSNAKRYHWAERYPADLVEFLAIRLALGWALLGEKKRDGMPHTSSQIDEAIEQRMAETYLRAELHGDDVLPKMAYAVDLALERGSRGPIDHLLDRYIPEKRRYEAERQARRLRAVAARIDGGRALADLSPDRLGALLETLRAFERQEGMLWLEAMESHAMRELVRGLNPRPGPPREKRPFAQALFCIDTRSERIRRHLEAVGDYQTFGIAGFFGVPVSFMELGKGSEMHLCPVILTPNNLALEISPIGAPDAAFVTALEKAVHDLKITVLTPFVTVEAIGLLFGFDMIGKTVLPQAYNKLRRRLHADKPNTRLLLDKLSREQADSIVRAVQRAVIEKAVEVEYDLPTERVTDAMVRTLREAALHGDEAVTEAERAEVVRASKLDAPAFGRFIRRLRDVYRITPEFAQQQMQQLGRIGFTESEQINYVLQALRAIGLTRQFSRFVLLVGHGSTSENNPYESALDCGACGGNHGLVSARVLAQMANKTVVRRALRGQGIHIPDDTWFVAGFHNTTTDQLEMHGLDLMPPTHLVYLDRLRNGLVSATRRCAQERVPSLEVRPDHPCNPDHAFRCAERNAMDWSQVRPEWGLARNAYFVIGRRGLTSGMALDGRAFLHSYDYRVDDNRRLLETILTGPLVVGQWINMEHYFSAVDNDRFGSGSKVIHNVAGRFGVMTGNLSDLRTGLPAQTVLKDGLPYHEPVRLITVIEAPLGHAAAALSAVPSVYGLVRNGWIRMLVIDPESGLTHLYREGDWAPYGSADPASLISENRPDESHVETQAA